MCIQFPLYLYMFSFILYIFALVLLGCPIITLLFVLFSLNAYAVSHEHLKTKILHFFVFAHKYNL